MGFAKSHKQMITRHRVSHKLRLVPNVQRENEGTGEFAGDMNIVAASQRFGVDITLYDFREDQTIKEYDFPNQGKPQVHIGRYNFHFVLLKSENAAAGHA